MRPPAKPKGRHCKTPRPRDTCSRVETHDRNALAGKARRYTGSLLAAVEVARTLLRARIPGAGKKQRIGSPAFACAKTPKSTSPILANKVETTGKQSPAPAIDRKPRQNASCSPA